MQGSLSFKDKSVKHARPNHTCRGQHLPDASLIETAADSFISLLLQQLKQDSYKVTPT